MSQRRTLWLFRLSARLELFYPDTLFYYYFFLNQALKSTRKAAEMLTSATVVHISARYARYRSQNNTLAFCTCGTSFSDQQRSLLSTVSPRKTCNLCQKSALGLH